MSTTTQTSVITLPYKQDLEQDDMQFYIGATMTLEGELKAERARTKTLQQKLKKQQQQHDAESLRFVGQNARLNQEIQTLRTQLAALRDICGFD